MNVVIQEKILTQKTLGYLNDKAVSNSVKFKSTILNCMGNNYLYYALVLTIVMLFTSCNEKGVDILTMEERTIVGGLYFGMPKDSLQYFLGKGINKAPFSINTCWPGEIQPIQNYYYTNSFDFTEFQVKGSNYESGHYGLVIPTFKNGRMSECYITIVNHNVLNGEPVAKQFANSHLLFYIPLLLQKSYGEDSISYDKFSSIMVIETSGRNYYDHQGVVHTFSPKFGKVQFNEGVRSDRMLWDDLKKTYWCYDRPVDSTLFNGLNEVNSYPCIHYKLDPKYEEQLGIKSEKPL
jgi:hypothetical protein